MVDVIGETEVSSTMTRGKIDMTPPAHDPWETNLVIVVVSHRMWANGITTLESLELPTDAKIVATRPNQWDRTIELKLSHPSFAFVPDGDAIPRWEQHLAETKLRRMLAMAYAGSRLYVDDGELQDNSKLPVIDFKRDPVDEITKKMEERALLGI